MVIKPICGPGKAIIVRDISCMYRIVQKFDEESFDVWLGMHEAFDEWIVGFIGEINIKRKKVSRKSLTNC